MLSARPNILVIVSDQHTVDAVGCYGHSRVQTPHLDRLASQGVAFDNAYCNSPLCTPSRLALLSGTYPHQIGAWDLGSVPPVDFASWGHLLEGAGYETVLCGRTALKGPDRLQGFGQRLIEDLDRWEPPRASGADERTGAAHHESLAPPDRSRMARRGSNSHATECGPGNHRYNEYDRTVIEHCDRFLAQKIAEPGGRPWLLYCGLMRPHFPLIAPPEYFDRYAAEWVDFPPTWREAPATQHPVIRHLRWHLHHEEPLSEEQFRRAILNYWALVTLTDDHIGQLLARIDNSRLHTNTLVLYTSDHGEMAGRHGLWQKHCFYEPSVRVPLILRLPVAGGIGDAAGGPSPARPLAGRRVRENVSLVDVLPTLLEAAGIEAPMDLPGRSLREIAATDPNPSARTVFSEFHGQGMVNAGYMVKQGDFKYCSYVGERPQLFNVSADPQECQDLAGDPGYADVLGTLDGELRRIVNPERVDARAKADQERRRHGGETGV